MTNTRRISILSVTFAFAFGACATEADQTSTTSLALLGATCGAEPDFPTWDHVAKLEEAEPELYKAANEAALGAATKCLDDKRYGCQPPVLDDKELAEQKWVFPYLACWKGTTTSWPEGREYIECCVTGLPSEAIVCDWAWINTGPTDPTPPPSP